MQTLDLSEGERSFLTDTRALSIDLNSDEILVGLSRDESLWYLDWISRDTARRRDRSLRDTTWEEQDRYLELQGRHEAARLQVIGAESAKRVFNPTIN